MALTSAQIVTLAVEIAKCPGFTQQAGQFLNAILSDLCQTYDLDVARGTFSFNFNPGLVTTNIYPNVTPGGGPYALPADFLRMADEKDAMWFLLGVPYPMIPCDLSEYDNLVQQAGLQSYPYIFATDMSQSPPNLLVYPPASGAYSCMIRYRRQMPDIVTPETSSVVPWFPNQQFLITKLGAFLMKITDDERFGQYDANADAILGGYLKQKDDQTNRAKKVIMDRRTFGRMFSTLRNTKTIGW